MAPIGGLTAVANGLAAGGKSCSGAAKFLRELAYIEAIHFEFERAERNAEVTGGCRDIPAGLFQRPQDEVAPECIRRPLEEAFAACRHAIELRKMKLERQVL